MSSFTGQELADFLYYRKLPAIYRDMDASETEKQDLYRYLQSIVQGGFNDTLEQIAAMTDLVNPLTCPVEFLPYLYQSFGLPYFEDIGEYYNRRFLASVGELLRRRGTIGGVRYLVRTLTGMESNITYERISTEEEKARILNVYPVFPDVTSLAEIEVTSYTIKRFLELYLPFYIRLTFFPSIETQYLNGEIRNGVSFANTLIQYLFNDRVRNLEITNNRSVVFYTSSFYNNVDKTSNYGKLFKSRNIVLNDYEGQELIVRSKLFSPLNTKVLSYDLTKLTGKKLQIGNWITHGDYKLQIPNKFISLLGFIRSELDLYKSQGKSFFIPVHHMNGFFSSITNDLKFEREKIYSIGRVRKLIGSRFKSYDLTGLEGKKLYSPNTIKSEYDFDIDIKGNIVMTKVETQDATFVEGGNIIADYFDVYNHSYNLRKNISKMFASTAIKSYNLIPVEEHFVKLQGEINSCTSNFTIIQYNLV